MDQIRIPGIPEHEASSQLTERLLPGDASEAGTQHALSAVGLASVSEHVMISDYPALAAAEDDEDRAARRAMRTRSTQLGV